MRRKARVIWISAFLLSAWMSLEYNSLVMTGVALVFFVLVMES